MKCSSEVPNSYHYSLSWPASVLLTTPLLSSIFPPVTTAGTCSCGSAALRCVHVFYTDGYRGEED